MLVLPATLWLAWRESVRGATHGQRLRGLMVVSARTGQRVSFGQALVVRPRLAVRHDGRHSREPNAY
ncbi:hypothetical protein E0H75_31395 [Kribbella capetownensis]|uniref:Uncharacterized protein n=1 Tax=Kribbella capetownensis TaxID=1572659 RepID=A0A4R0JT64_9ACTN|nr:hypothetical protein E0H75_31395 [Kribbella capetownensis]